MSQDLREMFKDIDSRPEHSIREGHEERFMERLDKEFHVGKKLRIPWSLVAASLVVLIGMAIYLSDQIKPMDGPVKTTVVDSDTVLPDATGISLGDLSPDLKKVENYYMVNINMELARLEISDRNKVLVDSFMEQLEGLNQEYKKLNRELNEIGPNDQTISALIKNLQLRLQLLYKLREKLQELKTQNTGMDQGAETTSI